MVSYAASLSHASKMLRYTLEEGPGKYLPMKYGFHGTWTHGLCLPLAMAVKKWQGRGRVMALIDTNHRIQHVVVVIGDVVIDGDGFRPVRELVAQWSDELMLPGNEPIDLAGSGDILLPREATALASRPLQSILRHRRRLSLDLGDRELRRDRNGIKGMAEELAQILIKRWKSRFKGAIDAFNAKLDPD